MENDLSYVRDDNAFKIIQLPQKISNVINSPYAWYMLRLWAPMATCYITL